MLRSQSKIVHRFLVHQTIGNACLSRPLGFLRIREAVPSSDIVFYIWGLVEVHSDLERETNGGPRGAQSTHGDRVMRARHPNPQFGPNPP